MKNLRVALVHDYLKEFGGAERVLQVLHEMFPEAPIYTIFSTPGSPAAREFKNTKIIQSWFSFIPFCEKLISPLRFLIPLIWANFNFKEFDIIISSASWAMTKGFVNGTPRQTRGSAGKPVEICYCHTPPRFLYGYETSRNWKKHWWVRAYAMIVNHFMRMYDFHRAQKVTKFVANSLEVQKRIEKFYRRDSTVIFPPVDIKRISNNISLITDTKRDSGLGQNDKSYFLTGGRLVLQKNFDLIVKACEKLKVPLKIYGAGPEEENLKLIAGKNVEFLGRISDEEKFKLMAGAKAFVISAVDEDFGITVVEAMAAGTPVVAYKSGGYLETVVDGVTGVFFDEYTVDSLVNAMKRVQNLKFEVRNLKKQAEKFSKERFVERMTKLINELK